MLFYKKDSNTLYKGSNSSKLHLKKIISNRLNIN